MKKEKTAKQMERHLKGMGNHHRIAILLYVDRHPDSTLEDIIVALDANERTIGEHARRLYAAGLIAKRYEGRYVLHSLTPYGKLFTGFLQSFRRV